MHIHVGCNIPGYLPEGDIGCFDQTDAAADYLADRLSQIEDDYYERCPNNTTDPDNPEQNCECAWCDLARDVYADRLHDGPTWHQLRTNGAWSALYTTPEGPDLAVWAAPGHSGRGDCDIHQNQEW